MSEETQNRILLVVALLAAILIQISIAGSQIFLGLGIVLLVVFKRNLPFPRIWLPLLLFCLWTVLADVLSPDPWGGRAQIRKFFVFLFIPLIYSVFRTQFAKLSYLILGWTAAASASSLWAFVQYMRTAHGSYIAYVGRRISGFESHWMTFGALQLAVLALIIAHWCFSGHHMPVWAYSSIAVIGAAILLSGTRSIWLAMIPSVLYLLWFWKPKTIIAVPALAALALAASPHNVRERALSLIHPQENVDSNRHRIVTFRTGLEMVKAHPWFGVGPEEIKRNFDSYVPRDIARPLPVGYYGHLHNIYVQYAAERGIPGLLFMMWLIGLAVWDCARGIVREMRSGPSEVLFLLHGTIAVTIGILAGGVFEYNLGDSEVLMMFLAVVSLGYAALYQRSKMASTARPEPALAAAPD